MPFLQDAYAQNAAVGEKISAYEFRATLDNNPDLSVLVRSSQIPGIGREVIEDKTSMGLTMNQHGALKNAGEISLQCVESGDARLVQFIIDAVHNRRYIDIQLELTPESKSGVANAYHDITLLHSLLASEAADVSTDDTTALLKFPINVTYNWIRVAGAGV
ncbi:MAG: baseplate protein [Oceanospirillaceae bacterium]|nr:baseplate protein [Oceanospirillaceae bacterium]